MTYGELLTAFGEKLGGAVELVPDESGAVALSIDDMTVSIIGLEEAGQVVLSGVVGEPPPEDRMEKLYKAMLEANHNFAGTFGATLSINPEDGSVSLCRALPLALADGDSFFAAVEHFVNVLETWKKLVTDFRGAADPATGSKAAQDDMRMGEMSGFMQV